MITPMLTTDTTIMDTVIYALAFDLSRMSKNFFHKQDTSAATTIGMVY